LRDRTEPGSKDPLNERGQVAAPQAETTSIWEWIVALIGFTMLVSTIGYLAYQAIYREATPPNIELRVNSIVAAGNAYLVKISAINHGGSTAGALEIAGELKNHGETVETSEATINYVPAQSQKEAGLFFTKDPRRYELQLRAKGYEEP